MSDSFASVWDAAGDEAEADQRLRSLTSARVQVAPLWGFLAAAKNGQEFGHRFALVEDQVRTAADERGVTFEVLAKSLVDDFRALRAEAAYYVKDGDKEVGGPYDSKADAQDAIDGGDVSGDNLTVSGGGDDSDDSDSDDDSDGDDDNTDEDSDSGSDDDPDDDASDDDGKGDNPFAKKSSLQVEARGKKDPKPKRTPAEDFAYWHPARCGNGNPHSPHTEFSRAGYGQYDCPGVPTGYAAEDPFNTGKPQRYARKTASASVVHQPGETVFVDHFMGHDEHEGRKGVWATVVKSPGQHPYADRADSHLLKPMAPGGTHFFHHFGGLQAQASDWWSSPEGKAHKTRIDNERRAGFKSGIGSYDSPPEPSYSFKPHRVYDSASSAINHLAGGSFAGSDYSHEEHREMARSHAANLSGYNHCPSCDHVYSTDHPDHTGVGLKDTCPNCGDTDHHESLPDLLSEHGHYDQHHERTTYDDPGPDYHGLDGDNYGDPYGRHDQRHEGAKTALADGVDPLQWIVETVPGGEGQAEVEAHHEGRTASIVDRFRAIHAEFATE